MLLLRKHVLILNHYNNLAIEVEKVNTVNRKLRETNGDLTTELARYKNQEKCFEISQEKYDKLERCYQKSVYQEKCLTKKINALHLSSGKQITTLNEEISKLNNQLSKEKSTVSSLNEEKKKAAKFVRDFKSLAKDADESLTKHKELELEIERLLRAVISQDIMSILQRMFRINPFKPSREENFVPNKVRAGVRTNLITVSQPHVITKKVINSNSNGLSSIGVDNTAKTRRPQPRSNTNNDRVPFVSKSSCIKNKEVENDKSEVVCAMCKQCLITANHDVCVLNYVNGMNSRSKKQKAKVLNISNQTKLKPRVKKPKKVGSNERLASPKPRKPRTFLRWSPTGRIFELKGKIIASSESECQSNYSNGDNAYSGCSKHMTGNLKLLIYFVWKFLGTVLFGNDHVAAILGY
ncbi:hypothetical protein Tco_0393897, partial [Tanacetum coccineum]